jgi:hypothetical protein
MKNPQISPWRVKKPILIPDGNRMWRNLHNEFIDEYPSIFYNINLHSKPALYERYPISQDKNPINSVKNFSIGSHRVFLKHAT